MSVAGSGDRDPRKRTMEEYAQLAQELGKVAEKHGLYLQQTGIIPPIGDDGPVMMNCAFIVGERAAEQMQAEANVEAPERESIGEGADELAAQFEDIIGGAAEAEKVSEDDQRKAAFENLMDGLDDD